MGDFHRLLRSFRFAVNEANDLVSAEEARRPVKRGQRRVLTVSDQSSIGAMLVVALVLASPGADAGSIPSAAVACSYKLGTAIYNKWVSFGGEGDILGCPIRDELQAERSPQGTTGSYSEFNGGDGNYIILHGIGRLAGSAFVVQGGVFLLYKSLGGTASWLGFPVSDEYDVPGGRRSDFEGGYVFWDAQTRLSHASQY